MDHSSWQEISSEFRRGAEAYPDVFANWNLAEGQWSLRCARAGEHPKLAEPEAQRAFTETARMAVRQLGKPLHEQPPWHIWLDLMRKSKRGFRTTRVVPFRVFKAAIEGRGLSDTSAFRIVGGSIHHVFQVSAEFCEDLAFGMPEGVPTLAADSGSPKAKHTGTTEPGGDESTCAEAGPAQQEKTGIAKQNGVKKRGRPQTIPDEKKEAALKKKNDGGTNRDAAKILYATTYPTDQQVKNVTSILENYKKRQSASRIAVPDPLLNPQKPNKSRV